METKAVGMGHSFVRVEGEWYLWRLDLVGVVEKPVGESGLIYSASLPVMATIHCE